MLPVLPAQKLKTDNHSLHERPNFIVLLLLLAEQSAYMPQALYIP